MNSAAKKWLAMVQAEHAQTERLRDQPNPHDDHWHGMTVSFRADPHRTDDPLLDRLAIEVQPHHTLIDVGSGPGRLALPPRPPLPSPDRRRTFPRHGPGLP